MMKNLLSVEIVLIMKNAKHSTKSICLFLVLIAMTNSTKRKKSTSKTYTILKSILVALVSQQPIIQNTQELSKLFKRPIENRPVKRKVALKEEPVFKDHYWHYETMPLPTCPKCDSILLMKYQVKEITCEKCKNRFTHYKSG